MHALGLACTYAALFGIASHVTYFIRGDHLHEAPILARLFFITPVLLFSAIKTFATSFSLTESAVWASAIFTSFVSSLWLSMLVYRLFFHPLRHFPGPIYLRPSSFLLYLSNGGKLNLNQRLDKWHDQFGDFVRTGPNELAIFAGSEALHALFGSGSRCFKGDWYAKTPISSMFFTTNKAAHTARRKIWDQGFSTKGSLIPPSHVGRLTSIAALHTYEELANGLAPKLAERFNEINGQSLNATYWFHCFSFDFMGEFAFGKTFGMTEKKGTETHPAVKNIQRTQVDNGGIGRIPWLYHTMFTAPSWLMQGTQAMGEWSKAQIENRLALEKTTNRADVMSYIIKDFHKKENKQEGMKWMIGDARSAIIAGSDTTASVLCFLFYYLSKYPKHVAIIREEVDSLANEEGGYKNLELQNSAPHLNAVINEALRLNPAVPSGLFRTTPPEGITIADMYIPGNTNVYAPFQKIQTLPSCFEDPKSFVPERWTTRPEMIRDKAAFAPFSIGPYACVGRQVALLELRILTATLVSNFDVKFAPGEDGYQLLYESQDCFAIQPKPLNLMFVPRNGVQNGQA